MAVPCVVPPCEHEYKYGLVYIKGGKRILGFDNERGIGDCIHQGGEARMHQFVDPETLILDFLTLLEECRR